MAHPSRENIPTELPILPLRDMTVFPGAAASLHIPGRMPSARVFAGAPQAEPFLVGLVSQRDTSVETPTFDDLYSVGTVARVLRALTHGNEPPGFVVLVQGIQRIRIAEGLENDPFLRARVELLHDVVPATIDAEFVALRDGIRNLLTEIIALSPNLPDEMVAFAAGIEDASQLADFAVTAVPRLDHPTRQSLLETLDVRERMRRITEELVKERQNLRVQRQIASDVEARLGASQRKLILHEQMKAIREALGEEGDRIEAELRERIEKARMPENVRKEAERELARLKDMPEAAAEHSVARTYLEWLVSLPWSVSTARVVDIRTASAVLDEDHYDLEKVKERILEFLAVMRLKRDLKGPLLCFVGPPGVGKTSLGRSIARATGRNFVRISLGGTNDEAEIRGHRRTYVGALPGQIIQGLRRAGTNDPVFMLDEIDKIGRDFRGDPAAALMEVLDPEQNVTFRDHYLDVPFDLSRVLFIATANVVEPIAKALLDRMEVLELPGYVEEEKLQIARRYLVPRQTRENGLEPEHVQFDDEALREMIRGYTHEAGVRNLERQIAAICRKHARQLATDGISQLAVTPDTVRTLLGVPRFHVETEIEERTRHPGVAVALAWTPEGGDVLFVEATRMPKGKGEFIMTGQLGDVMRESARAALSWLRANAVRLGLDPGAMHEVDVHLHVPAGAVPKDGPSAGLAMIAALASLFTGRPLRSFVAVTGEITLSGAVLPVGGIREKLLAARRSGVREVILPLKNEPNAREDLPAPLAEGLQLHFVQDVEQMLELCLTPEPRTTAPLFAATVH